MSVIHVQRVPAAAVVAVAALLSAGCAAGQGSNAGDTAEQTAPPDVAASDSHHEHGVRNVPRDRAPTLSLQVSTDSEGGWNLHLATRRFTFAPEHAGEDPRPGEGHAHVYVDDEKVGRAYGPWVYLPADAAPSGQHTVTVTLNANDHATYAVGGDPIEDTATITGGTAGGTGHGDDHGAGAHNGGTPSGTPNGTPNGGAADVDETIRARIVDGEVRPAPGRVEVDRGSRIRIQVTSDEPDELHVHGYDEAVRLRPGEPGAVQFVADQTGLFEVETHHGGVTLFQLLVR